MGSCKSCLVTKVKPAVSNAVTLNRPEEVQNQSLDTLIRRHSRSPNPQKHKHPILDCRGDSIKIALTGRLIENAPSESEQMHILRVLRHHYILKYLNEESHRSIIQDLKQYEYPPREVIIKQNDPGCYFFILSKGRVEILVNHIRKTVLSPYTSFGDTALLDFSPLTSTVQTTERSTVWTLDRNSFKAAVQTVNEMCFEENKYFLDAVPLFDNLTKEQKVNLLYFVNTQKWDEGELIVQEGEIGSLLYIIKEGTVICSKKGKEIRRMSRGELFGEQALLHSSARTATVKALDTVKVLSLSNDNLVQCFGDELERIIYKNSMRMALEQNKALSGLSAEQRESIVAHMDILTVCSGQVIVPTSQTRGQTLWIVLRGKLQSYKAYPPLSCIGDTKLYTKNAGCYKQDIIAAEDSTVAQISREKIEGIIGGDINTVFDFNHILKVLSVVPILRGLPRSKLALLAQRIEKCLFNTGSVIVEEGTPGDSFYLIKSGDVTIFKQGVKLRELGENSYFGERALLTNELRTASVVAKSPVISWQLAKSDFLELIDGEMNKELLKRMQLQDDSVELRDLVYIKDLGNGMSGQVMLCGHAVKKTLYALKIVSRELIKEYNLYSSLQAERNILLQLDHPMIMKLVKTYKDSAQVYFLTEFVDGLDLFDSLRHIGLMNEKDSKFYIGCFILILEHLHDKEIVYRDLKPENVILDDKGFPKLIDMGTAKIVHGRTYTTVGTPHYIAPEIIVGAGYEFPVDWWSLGVMLYEFVYGDVPFGADQDDPAKIYRAVLNGTLTFPHESEKLQSFITTLLHPKPHLRANGDIKNMKIHSWMARFDWEALITRSARAPFIPKIQNYEELLNQNTTEGKFVRNVLSTDMSPVHLPNSQWDSEF